MSKVLLFIVNDPGFFFRTGWQLPRARRQRAIGFMWRACLVRLLRLLPLKVSSFTRCRFHVAAVTPWPNWD